MSLILGIFQFGFGCRHRHLSRMFTIKHRTYRVCFDCGWEFDLPNVIYRNRIDRSFSDHPLREQSSSSTLILRTFLTTFSRRLLVGTDHF